MTMQSAVIEALAALGYSESDACVEVNCIRRSHRADAAAIVLADRDCPVSTIDVLCSAAATMTALRSPLIP